jgi:hypothetical protein
MRNRKFLGIVICTAILVASLLAVERGNTYAKKDYKPLSLLPKDAGFVVVVDMKKVVDTKYYNKFKQDEIKLDDYNEFIEKTGVDPEKDLDKVALSLSEIEDDADFVLIATGRFDKEKILSSIREEAKVFEDEYQGKTLYQITDRHVKYEDEGEIEEEEAEVKRKYKKDEVTLSFLDSDIVAISNSDLIKNTVDLYQGKGESIENNQVLMEVMKEIDQDDMVWGAGVVPEKVKKMPPTGHPIANVAATIKSIVFSIDLQKELDAFLKIKSDCKENVKNITDALNGFLALGRMNYAEQPKYMELLEGILIEGTEDMVSVSMHMSEEMLDWLSEEIDKKKCQKKIEKEN